MTEPPGVAEVTPSVLLTDRSACAARIVSLSVAALLPGVGSVTEDAIDALLDSVPAAAELIVQPDLDHDLPAHYRFGCIVRTTFTCNLVT